MYEWVRTKDVWLKMHSGQQAFAGAEGQLAQLLGLYRSASLEVVEGMMRHPQLEKIADEHANKKVRRLRTVYISCPCFVKMN